MMYNVRLADDDVHCTSFLTKPSDFQVVIVLGIDPGSTGAIAVLEHRTPARVFDMPETIADLAMVIRSSEPDHVFVEYQQAFPGQGIASTGKLLQHYGSILGILAMTDANVVVLRPAAWKKSFGLSSDKNASRLLAQDLFSHISSQLSRKKDHGRAEALLIGLAGTRMLNL